jgi:hypothetical protein
MSTSRRNVSRTYCATLAPDLAETHYASDLRRRVAILLSVGFSFAAKQAAGHGYGKLNCSKHFRLPESS